VQVEGGGFELEVDFAGCKRIGTQAGGEHDPLRIGSVKKGGNLFAKCIHRRVICIMEEQM